MVDVENWRSERWRHFCNVTFQLISSGGNGAKESSPATSKQQNPPNPAAGTSQSLDSFSSNAWILQAPFLFLIESPSRERLSVLIISAEQVLSLPTGQFTHAANIKHSSICNTSPKNHLSAEVQGLVKKLF